MAAQSSQWAVRLARQHRPETLTTGERPFAVLALVRALDGLHDAGAADRQAA